MAAAWARSYVGLTRFLGQTLGPDYEVALYDLSVSGGAVIAIANGHVTQRGVGAALPPLERQWLADRRAGRGGERINATSMAASGTLLRSSCWLIRTPAGEPCGLLAINFDDGRYRDLGARILRLRHPDAFADSHFSALEELPLTQSANKAELAEASLREVLGAGNDVTHFGKRERRALVRSLDARGYFLLKGAVRLLAERLGCSVASVYRYQNELAKARSRR